VSVIFVYNYIFRGTGVNIGMVHGFAWRIAQQFVTSVKWMIITAQQSLSCTQVNQWCILLFI